MRQFISYYAIRESKEERPKRIQPRAFVQTARSALVNISGLTYPNIQSTSMWTNVRDDGEAIVFIFDQRSPFGDLRIESDCSYASTRAPLEEESERMIFLEALTWEFVFNMEFFDRFITGLRREGIFRIGISLGGFENAHVDWSGFIEDKQANEIGTLINWRFRPQRDIVSFEADGVKFPSKKQKDDVNASIARVIAELSFKIAGVRHHPISGDRESRLELSDSSISWVVKQAREQLEQNGKRRSVLA